MFFFLFFFIFSNAEHDCYRIDKNLLLNSCIRPADTDSNNILNATEIDNYLTLHQTPIDWISIFNKTELDMTDWNSLNEIDILQLCFHCQYIWHLI